MRIMRISWIHGEAEVIVNASDSEALHEFLTEHMLTDYSVNFTDYTTRREMTKVLDDAHAEIARLNDEVRHLQRRVGELARFVHDS